MSFVNAYTQWGKLKRIVVGVADNACFQPKQPCHKPKINDDKHVSDLLPWPSGRKLQKTIEKANVQLQNLCDLLEKEGVQTYRPEIIDWSKPIVTPQWSVPNQYCSVCPRDVMLTVGKIMVEAPMSRRDRFFEVFAYRELTQKFWKEDAKSMWKAAPKSSMNDSMYSPDWLEITEEQRIAALKEMNFCLKKDKEIVFDAADFTRTGKHVFGQVGMTTNMQGIQWLHRELEPHGFIVHPLRIQQDSTPSHIDCTFVVLRPGLVMENIDRPLNPKDKQLWIDNGWKFITAPHPNNSRIPHFSQSSKWLNMNVLVIAEDKVIVEAEEVAIAHLLEDNGFKVLPINFRDVFEFGGSLHCATWDIEREDEAVDLFPKFKLEESEWHNEMFRNKSQVRGYVSLPSEKNINYNSSASISQTHLKIEGHPVMEAWEKPYMYALADKVASQGGAMLEVGFGMSLSAGAIQSHSNVTQHTIIEINPDVYQTLLQFKQSHPNVKPLHGSWQDKIQEIPDQSIDGILYDPFPSNKSDQHTHQFDFIKLARNKLKIGGRLTYCNLTSLGVLKSKSEYNMPGKTKYENWKKLFQETQIPHLLQAGWKQDEIEFEVYELPSQTIKERDLVGCQYYSHSDCLVPYLVRKS